MPKLFVKWKWYAVTQRLGIPSYRGWATETAISFSNRDSTTQDLETGITGVLLRFTNKKHTFKILPKFIQN